MLGAFVAAAIAVSQLKIYSLIVTKAEDYSEENDPPKDTVQQNTPGMPVLALKRSHPQINNIKNDGEPGATTYSVTAIPGSNASSEDLAISPSLHSEDERPPELTALSCDPRCACSCSVPNPPVVPNDTPIIITRTEEIVTSPNFRVFLDDYLETPPTVGTACHDVVRPPQAVRWPLELVDSFTPRTSHALSGFLVFLLLALVRLLSRNLLLRKNAQAKIFSPWSKGKDRTPRLSLLTFAEVSEDVCGSDSELSMWSEDRLSEQGQTCGCAENSIFARNSFRYEDSLPGACTSDPPRQHAAASSKHTTPCGLCIINKGDSDLGDISHGYPSGGVELDFERPQHGKISIPEIEPQVSIADPIFGGLSENGDSIRVSPNITNVDISELEAYMYDESSKDTLGHLYDCADNHDGMTTSEQFPSPSTFEVGLEEEGSISEGSQVEKANFLIIKSDDKDETTEIEQSISDILPVALAEAVSEKDYTVNLTGFDAGKDRQQSPDAIFEACSYGGEDLTMIASMLSPGTHDTVSLEFLSHQHDILPDQPLKRRASLTSLYSGRKKRLVTAIVKDEKSELLALYIPDHDATENSSEADSDSDCTSVYWSDDASDSDNDSVQYWDIDD